MTAYYRAAGNYRSALLYADSAAAANDDWKRQIDVMLKHKAEIAMEMERYESRQVLLEKEKQQQLMQRNFLIALMGLSLLVVALLYRHQHTRNRHRQEQLVKEKQMAQAELQNAQILLDQLYQTVQQKSQLIEQLETGIESDRGSTVLAQAVQPHLLMELRRSVLLTEQNWQSFVELFEKVHSGFFARLKEQLPDLTPAETRFMALSRLGYSAREQAGMLGVSTGAIRQYRYTIRRKLALGEEVDMKEIAGKI
jgi:DNA-binding CsgD family transcriptional regulator